MKGVYTLIKNPPRGGRRDNNGNGKRYEGDSQGLGVKPE